MKQIFTKEEIKYAEKIHREKGKSFYFGTVFFPKELREAIHVLYAFVRIPDDYVDQPEDKDERVVRNKILAWKEKWHKDFLQGKSEEFVFQMSIKLFNTYQIPFQYSLDFLDAMISDTLTYRYANYEKLEAYMWGSASVVGIMLTHICGYVGGKNTVDKARLLGDAFQITNFLRDIGEDYRERARIYMPLDELQTYGITELDIKKHMINSSFVNFMKFQIKRNREMYTNAEQGIAYLANARVRLGVTLASKIYSKILNKIEKNHYDVFTFRATTSYTEKIIIAIPVIIKWCICDMWRSQKIL